MFAAQPPEGVKLAGEGFGSAQHRDAVLLLDFLHVTIDSSAKLGSRKGIVWLRLYRGRDSSLKLADPVAHELFLYRQRGGWETIRTGGCKKIDQFPPPVAAPARQSKPRDNRASG